VAQPALSHQVKLLELELGIELFERSRGGVRLTEAGEIFIVRARRALAEVDAARDWTLSRWSARRSGAGRRAAD